MNTWFTPADCRLDDFRTVVEQKTDPNDYPHAAGLESNVLLYSADVVRAPRADATAELARALLSGPGIVVFKGAFPPDVVDRATDIFFAMIAEQKAAGVAGPLGRRAAHGEPAAGVVGVRPGHGDRRPVP